MMEALQRDGKQKEETKTNKHHDNLCQYTQRKDSVSKATQVQQRISPIPSFEQLDHGKGEQEQKATEQEHDSVHCDIAARYRRDRIQQDGDTSRRGEKSRAIKVGSLLWL